MLLIYVRHGDPIYNPDSLTPLGERQAEAVGKRIAMHGVDKIFASSSNRAKLTAKPACEMLKKEMTILDWCNEAHAWAEFTFVDPKDGKQKWDFHTPEIVEFYNRKEILDLGDNWYDHPMYAGTKFKEGDERIKRETYAFLAELGYEYDEERRMYHAVRPNDDRIALFAHQGFGIAFLGRVLGIPRPLFCSRFDMGHTGMTVIQFGTNREYVTPKILTLANDSHIYREGLPTAYQNTIYF